ncbi:glycosylhydrolase-like jelly roll fold domain-containing protein [Salipaludibacillus sp. HK11]|uniref:glycosylhydrolase-like jelly roll fold domain-containing protein n=1 Tax=Salipaludibacillus sp. HK11 TaxID=3394320 RepID=UPI0039FBE18A
MDIRELHEQAFMYPGKEYTPMPFWFWNDDLNEDEIRLQIKMMDEKGVNGFVLHPRIGLPDHIEYLSDLFFHYIVIAVEEAENRDMRVLLYDEGMYPSGAANGQVVKENQTYQSRGLNMVVAYSNEELSAIRSSLAVEDHLVSVQKAKYNRSLNSFEKDSVELMNDRDSIDLLNEGESFFIFYETPTGGTIRGIHQDEDDGEVNAPASADLLNPEAVLTFIRLTHDTYYSYLKKYFGNTVIGFFTDEPDITGRNSKKNVIPWNVHFTGMLHDNQWIKEKDLAFLWLNNDKYGHSVKQDYRRHVKDRLSNVYYKQLYDWCDNRGISLTGHPADSDDIGLMKWFHIPGQDVVWRWVAPEKNLSVEGIHSTAGKCSADAARHRKRWRNINEFLGVCGKKNGWDLTPGDYKWYIDWLAVRGVNMFCPHAFYYSVRGKLRSHERPPDVGFYNSWWPYYKLFTNYMKRLSWLMTDSTNMARIAIVCSGDNLPWKKAKLLFENQIEFNYLEESLLLNDSFVQNDHLFIGGQKYSTLIVEDQEMLLLETMIRLEKVKGGGVSVINWDTDTITGDFEIVDLLRGCAQLVLKPASSSIRVSSVVKDGYIYHFLVNENNRSYDGKAVFSVTSDVELWDPWTESMECVRKELIKRKQGVPVYLEPNSSVILKEMKNYSNKGEVVSISHDNEVSISSTGWKIMNIDHLFAYDKLTDWSSWEKRGLFSGTLTYKKVITLDSDNANYAHTIDAGAVYEIAELYINDQYIGVKMWAPYKFHIPEMVLKPGINSIEFKVTNSKANQMDRVKQKSGLIGPIKLIT